MLFNLVLVIIKGLLVLDIQNFARVSVASECDMYEIRVMRSTHVTLVFKQRGEWMLLEQSHQKFTFVWLQSPKVAISNFCYF